MLFTSEKLATYARSASDLALANGAIERVLSKDATLWRDDHHEDVASRLGWVDAHMSARALLEPLTTWVRDVHERGLDRVVLCGMGGSSLAPEVICRNAGVDLNVLDSSHPDMIEAALTELERTIVVVSSKSGTTLETESQLHQFVAAFESHGLSPSEHIAVVTDPGSALDAFAASTSLRVFHGDPEVGGRYSALTAFGLVPSALAGADVELLLDEATAMARQLQDPSRANPAVQLAAAISAVSAEALGLLAIDDREQRGLGDWIEQLVAESLGKEGKGTLPLMLADIDPYVPDHALRIILGSVNEPLESLTLAIDEPLGGQFLLWECATTIAGHLMGLNPFDQPNVESSKAAARELLDNLAPADPPAFIDGTIRAWGTDASDLESAIRKIRDSIAPDGFLGLCWFLDRWELQGLETLAADVAQHIQRPVTFGWGPRYLHSTGQLHKGGPPVGSFIHLSAPSKRPRKVAKQDFTWGELLESQVRGDAQVLREKGLSVLRLEISSVQTDLERIRQALLD